jgi:FMN phosphatase YigB (HAD superfamily)
MKLVADFDGVLTELQHEAARVLELFESEWLKLTPDSSRAPRIRELLHAAKTAIEEKPQNWGWEVHGRISAYSDEDHFIRVNALAAWLDHQNREGAIEEWKPNGLRNFKQLAQHAYETMVREVMASSLSPIDPFTAEVVRKLHSNGVEIVVTSNSGTERILDIFKKNDIPALPHPEHARETVRVRGGARKFELGEKPGKLVEFLGRKVEISRPVYEQALLEEYPDAVIGDVFSLDLSTPLSLVESYPEKFPRGLKLFLRVRDYTPEWSKRIMREWKHPKVSLYEIHDLRELVQKMAN